MSAAHLRDRRAQGRDLKHAKWTTCYESDELRFLILSDIHANLEALNAVLQDASRRQYEAVLCLGDIVGYGPNPNEVAAWVHSHADVVIRGNHDKACSGAEAYSSFNPTAQCSSQWTREHLQSQNARWLLHLTQGPVRVEDFQLVHGAPDDEDRYMFHEYEAERGLVHAEEPVTFFGHTHVQGGFIGEPIRRSYDVTRLTTVPGQMALRPDRIYLLNPGAVGQPRDGDARAAYCVYDSTARVVEFCRVMYDIRSVQEKILAFGLPEELALRLASGD
jgi:predicted phosphodiesterase